MNSLQNLFAIIFGIYFATTVATSGRFEPFDTAAIFAGDRPSRWRLLVAFLTLDILPFAYFLFILWRLGPDERSIGEALVRAWGVLFAGLAAFGLYRLFASCMYVRRRGQPDSFHFYSEPPRAVRDSKHSACSHALGGLTWLIACYLLFELLMCVGRQRG